MPLPNITQENGTLEFNGKATITVGNGQPANTPGLQLSGGILQLDPGSYVTSDLTATGSGVWLNPRPSNGTADTLLAGAVNWSSSGYISVGDMGGSNYTHWVTLTCNQFTMHSGTLNLGVGTAQGTGDTVVVQGTVSLDPNAGDNAALALYAAGRPGCYSLANWQVFITANNGNLSGSFDSVVPYTGSPWLPLHGWTARFQDGKGYIYWT